MRIPSRLVPCSTTVFRLAGVATAFLVATTLLLGQTQPLSPPAGATSKTDSTISLAKPLTQRGTVSFILHTDRTNSNGAATSAFSQTLVSLPGLADCEIRRRPATVDLLWSWTANADPTLRGFAINMMELPGPESYYLQFTWDADRGLCDGYLNGNPLCLPGTRFDPWTVTGSATQAAITTRPNDVTDVTISDQYLTPEEAAKAVPAAFRGKRGELVGYSSMPPPIDMTARRGKLLYQVPLTKAEDVSGWVMEGPGEFSFVDQAMQLRTAPAATSAPSRANPGHFVFWCPREFPDSFVAEWDFQAISRTGLAIVFFAAKGPQDQDVLDSSLPRRNGVFAQYTNSSLRSYHISYFANLPLYQTGRPTSNLRKNPPSYATAQGPIAIPPGTQGFQHIRLIKDGSHIQLQANGKVSIDWNDDNPSRYGPAYHAGKIALRQMVDTLGAYRNFSVWELNPAH